MPAEPAHPLARSLNWTVIFMDDEEPQREAVCDKLRELTSWTVIGVETGDECLEAFRERNPEVLILDKEILTGDLQGPDVVKEVFARSKQAGGEPPIIVMLTKYQYKPPEPRGHGYIEKRYYQKDKGALVRFVDVIHEARVTGRRPEDWPLLYDPDVHGF